MRINCILCLLLHRLLTCICLQEAKLKNQQQAVNYSVSLHRLTQQFLVTYNLYTSRQLQIKLH